MNHPTGKLTLTSSVTQTPPFAHSVVREIERINKAELARGGSGSWHDQYKDSAYIFVGGECEQILRQRRDQKDSIQNSERIMHSGRVCARSACVLLTLFIPAAPQRTLTGLASELTEGDVITIFSQYGEPVDINLPRDKQTGKTRGFGFLMYEDQRSTVLAVDNLNGAKVLGRTLRVDHVSKYKQLEKGEDGKFKESESERMNARPELFMGESWRHMILRRSGGSAQRSPLSSGLDWPFLAAHRCLKHSELLAS